MSQAPAHRTAPAEEAVPYPVAAHLAVPAGEAAGPAPAQVPVPFPAPAEHQAQVAPVPAYAGPAEAEAEAEAWAEPHARADAAVPVLPHTRPTPAAEVPAPEPARAPYGEAAAPAPGTLPYGASPAYARPVEAPAVAAPREAPPTGGPGPDHPAPRYAEAPEGGASPYGDVPAARVQPEAETGAETEAETGTGTEPELRNEPAPAPDPAHRTPAHSGVPGPGVAEIVALAVTRGLRRETAEDDDTQDIPRVAPLRGSAVTEVPLHLPFRGGPVPSAPAPRPAPARPAVRRPAPGRRVPRGDDRLREHRGPVLPGWIGVVVGGLALAGCSAVLWRAGAVPAPLAAAFGATPRPYEGLRASHWPPLAFLGVVALLALGGLGRARAGHAWVLTLFGRYRGTVRRTGLTWVSPLLLRRRIDVRLRHWRSEPMPAVDSGGLALQVVVQVVWQVKDTARATLAVADHTAYLAEQVESAMARVLSQLPADAFHEDAPTLRDAEAVGDALTRLLAAETEAVGIEVFSAQPTRIEYAAEVAEAMRRRRVAAIDAKHRDTVLTSVVDAVDDTVHRLTSRGIVELDDYERKALVKDLTVAFYTGRAE
ncbi:SPFH domain-containing protein [Streptomyces subrutilus]|uniref:SPFH domain-containing protein n=1 Tax=Streptomyces subrutilus TaxID=36818 RepID=UPI0034151A48